MTQASAAFDASACIHDLFERQAAQRPDAVAVVFQKQVLSYAELNARANRISVYLRGMGVGPDVLVAICMHRSSDLIIGILAILKAGGAYVPLDPFYPLERLAYLIKDSAPAIVLSHQAAESVAREAVSGMSEPPPLVDMNSAPDIQAANPDRATFGLRSAHLAYVIYTSGSTGQPKGVMVEHRSVVNLLADMTARLSLTPGDAAPAITPISFDIAGLELHLPLSAGQTVLLFSRGESRDPFVLKNLLDRDDLAFVQATPSAWQGLLRAGWRSRGAPILCGGESLPAPLARRMIEQGAALWNVYGPTETSIWSSAALVSNTERITIGTPVANTRIYILDPALRPVPAGVSGEIHIGGAGVARGYLNRSELTAERFIASPFVDGDRLYRTGDFGRWLSDGQIEFIGRADSQVKIRGARIELGEIEACLALDPHIAQSVVVVCKDRAGADRLAAYVVPVDGAAPKPNEVRARVAARLPDYMTPDICVVLDQFPLTPNGKLDRSALPPPDQAGSEHDDIETPNDGAERLIAQTWADVLGEKAIGRHDSFFELGGNSMLMIAVAAKIQELLCVQIDLQAFFAGPTIACLAAQVARAESSASAPTAHSQTARC
ncbi:MAG TPA: non-ribosomal peptide synthetase [Caulobacterales bacterium]|nr:non-ribosomal peptide synthetase [Caulobacterales bacterium]